jgi:cell division protein FtsI (penicillin-binding protein 3)
MAKNDKNDSKDKNEQMMWCARYYSWFCGALVVVFILALFKASYIMFVQRDYWKQVSDRFVKDSVVVKPNRGNILSADGQLMASSLPEYKIYMDFMVSKKKHETADERETRLKQQHVKDSVLTANLDSICRGLHDIFPDRSVADFKAHIQKGRRKESRYFLLYPKRISYIQYKAVKQLPVFNLSRYKSGFFEETFNQRKKPFGSLAKHTLGDMYPAKDSAKNGLELAFDSLLRGTDGITHRQKVMNKYLNVVDVPPIDGCDIVTTLDVDMQDIAEKALVDELTEINATVGVAVLMEVATGDVKAIVNMTRCSDGVYREVHSNAISDMMEPGSVFKTASMMVALEDGMIDLNDGVDTGNGVYMMHGRKMKDHNWNRGGYQYLTVPQILMYSSNIGVSRIIDEHYHDCPQKFVDGIYRLGLPNKLNLQLGGEGTPFIRQPNGKGWSKTALAWMSIGYETLIPPIYTLTFYNAIANNGVMVKPRFVTKAVRDGETVAEYPVEVLKEQICSETTLKKIQYILEKVVSEGLGKRAGSKQFHVSGKTGTAQVASGGHYTTGAKYLVSFCGYFPSENPKYSCMVAIQKSGLPASGGVMAGGVFSKIAEGVYAKNLAKKLEEAVDSNTVVIPTVKRGELASTGYVLKELGIPVRWEASAPAANEMAWGVATSNAADILLSRQENDDERVEDVLGMGAKDAVYLLERQGLRVMLSGLGKVTSQSMAPGSKFQKGQSIRLQLK